MRNPLYNTSAHVSPSRVVTLTIRCCLLFSAFLIASQTAAASSAPPAIAVHPLSTTVVRGDPVTLDCRASSSEDDDAVLEWYRDGRPVDIDPSVSMTKKLQICAKILFCQILILML